MDYDERLGVPLRWWVQGTMLVASLWLAVVVALPEAAAWLVTAVAMLVLAAVLLSVGAARADRRATASSGPAGPASPGEHLGAATALDPESTRRIAGVEADARAYLLLRPYLKRAVKVEITDPADPAPYWLVEHPAPRRARPGPDRTE